MYNLLVLLLPDGLAGLNKVLTLEDTDESTEKDMPKNLSQQYLSPVDEKEDMKPGEIAKQRNTQKLNDLYFEARDLITHFNKQNATSLNKCIRNTLETIKRRVTSPSTIQYGDTTDEKMDHRPALKVKLVLAYPQVAMKPALEEVQGSLNTVVKNVLAVLKKVLQWGQRGTIPGLDAEFGKGAFLSAPSKVLQAQSGVLNAASGVLSATSGVLASQSGILASRSGVLANQSSVLSNPSGILSHSTKSEPMNFFKQVAEHKEVAKLVSIVGSTISSAKGLVVQMLDQYKKYEHLWTVNRDEHMTSFLEESPILSEFEAKMKEYTSLDDVLAEEEESVNCGALSLTTGQTLVQEVFEKVEQLKYLLCRLVFTLARHSRE